MDEGDPPSAAEPGGASPPDQAIQPEVAARNATPADQPVVAWAAPVTGREPPSTSLYGPGGPAFTVGALLSDAFARYGADPIRLYLVALLPSVVSLVISSVSVASAASGEFSLASTLALTVLAVVAGTLGTGILLSLIEGGRSAPIGRVIAHGVRRSGWLFATVLAVGLIVVLAFLAMVVPASLFLQAWPVVAGLAALVASLVVVWLVFRLYAAVVATVVDDLSPSQAIGLSWRVSRPAGVWLRILAAALVLSLATGPASFAGGLITGAAAAAPVPALVVGALMVAFVTPLAALGLYSAYRRLVAQRPRGEVLGKPLEGTWPEEPYVPSRRAWQDPDGPAPSAPLELPLPDESPLESSPGSPAEPGSPPESPLRAATPAFHVPPFARAAKAVLALTLVLSAVGLIAVPFAIGQLLPVSIPGAGDPALPGAVAPGTVAFGRSANLRTCTVAGQRTAIARSEPVVWMGAFERPITFTDEVRIRVTLDGELIIDEVQDPGFYACLGNDEPEFGLPPGRYVFELQVNGELSASGTLVVT